MAQNHFKPQPFTGKEDVDAWLNSFTRYADFANWDNHRKYFALKTMFKEGAAQWLQRLDHEGVVNDYDLLVVAMREKYQLQPSQIFQLRQQLLGKTQGPLDVSTYAEEVEHLCHRLNIDEVGQLHYFIKGLQPKTGTQGWTWKHWPCHCNSQSGRSSTKIGYQWWQRDKSQSWNVGRPGGLKIKSKLSSGCQCSDRLPTAGSVSKSYVPALPSTRAYRTTVSHVCQSDFYAWTACATPVWPPSIPVWPASTPLWPTLFPTPADSVWTTTTATQATR